MELDQAEKFLKYIPPGAETGAVLVGEADFIDHPVSTFVRLNKAREMGLQVNSTLHCLTNLNWIILE